MATPRWVEAINKALSHPDNKGKISEWHQSDQSISITSMGMLKRVLTQAFSLSARDC